MAVFQRTASFATKCLRCGGDIRPGERILWSSTDQRAKHQKCPKPVVASAAPPEEPTEGGHR